MTAGLREAAQAVQDARHPKDHAEAVDALVALALALPDAPRDAGWAAGAESMREAMAKMLLAEERRHSSVRAKDALIIAHTKALILPVPSAPTQAGDPWPPCEAAGTLVKARPEDPGTPCPCGAPSYQWHRSTPQCRHVTDPVRAPEASPCPAPNCHAGMLRDHNGRDSVSCPVCDGTLTADAYRSLEKTHGIGVHRAAPEAKTAESVEGWRVEDGKGGILGGSACIFGLRKYAESAAAEYGDGMHPVRVRIVPDPDPAPVEPEETHR